MTRHWEWTGKIEEALYGKEDLTYWTEWIGIVRDIRADSGRVWFTFHRPGSMPEALWMKAVHFDGRLRDGD